MLRITALSRESFLTWIAGGRVNDSVPLKLTQLKGVLRDCECAVISTNEMRLTEPNPIICVTEKKKQEFLAFSSTYVGTLTPLTAFYRVLGEEELRHFINVLVQGQTDLSPSLPDSIVSVCVAEAFMRSDARYRSTDDVSISAIHATLSSSLFFGLKTRLIGDSSSVKEFGQRWYSIQRLLSHSNETFAALDVIELWSIVSDSLGFYDLTEGNRSNLLVSCIREMLRSGDISENIWKKMTESFLDVSSMYDGMRGPREERVKYLKIIHSKLSPFVGSRKLEVISVLGLSLAMVGDGSLQYLPLSNDFDKDSASAVLWYGLWSGLMRASKVLTANNSLGRRAVRDLKTPPDLFSVPTADLNFNEISQMDLSEVQSNRLKKGMSSAISIEVMPGVISRFRLKQDRGSKEFAESRRRSDIQQQVSELGYLLSRVNQHVSKMSAFAEEDIFSSQEKSSNRRRDR